MSALWRRTSPTPCFGERLWTRVPPAGAASLKAPPLTISPQAEGSAQFGPAGRHEPSAPDERAVTPGGYGPSQNCHAGVLAVQSNFAGQR